MSQLIGSVLIVVSICLFVYLYVLSPITDRIKDKYFSKREG